MPYYHKLGHIPHRRHPQFRKPDGSLYREEVMGREGFHGVESILYHHFLPPKVIAAEPLGQMLDVVGWDGYLYPWALSIHDFEPITGRVHQLPPVHQTFQADGFVVCSFVPRLFDYHPQGIPAPYNHSNVNSDEVIYYCDGNFMSRKGIKKYDLTLHPSGLPHGPQPGATEASIGAKETQELAVMVDTFHPLNLTEAALGFEKPEYQNSWLEGAKV